MYLHLVWIRFHVDNVQMTNSSLEGIAAAGDSEFYLGMYV